MNDRKALDAVRSARDVEREHCAQIAERLCDEGRDGYQIAKVIRAGIRSPLLPRSRGDAL